MDAQYFPGLEALEPRALCTAAPLTKPAPTSASPAAASAPLQVSLANTLDIVEASVTINAAAAKQIADALDAGQDVTVEATAGSIVQNAPIVALSGKGTLRLIAADHIELGSNVRIAGPFVAAAPVVVQSPGVALQSGGGVEIAAFGEFDPVTNSARTLVIGGSIQARGQVTLETAGDMLVNTVRSDSGTPVGPDSDPLDALTSGAIVLRLTNFFGSIALTGLLATDTGSIAINAPQVELGPNARITAQRGHATLLVEELDAPAGSLIQADRGDVAIFGRFTGDTLAGTLRALGDTRADILLATRPAGNLRIDPGAVVTTEGGDVRVETDQLEVLGSLDTRGGDLVTDTDTFRLAVIGDATFANLVTPDSGGSPGTITLAVEGGTATVLGRIATRGGRLNITLDNGVTLDAQTFFNRNLDRTRASSLTLGPKASLDTRATSGGTSGGDIDIDVAHSSLIVLPGATILSGGGDVRITAEGAYVPYSVDPDGNGPRGIENRVGFFAAALQLDGVINTVGPGGGGALHLPTVGANVRLGTAKKSRFLAAAGSGAVTLTAAAANGAGRPAQGGQVTLARLIAGSAITVDAPLLRLAGRSTLISTTDDVTITSAVLGTRASAKRRAKGAAASLTVRSADDVQIGGDVRKLRDLKLTAADVIDLSRPLTLPVPTAGSSTALMRLDASRVLLLDADAVLVREHGLSINASDGMRVKIRRPLSLFAAGDIRVDAPAAALKAVDIVTAGAVDVDVKRLSVAGDVYANGGITVESRRIAGAGFTASTFAGKVTVNAPPASAKKVQTASLPAAIDPDAFDAPAPVFSFPGGTVTL